MLDAVLRIPGIGGPSLSSSYLGMFIVFVYMWLPFMILPLAAALERVPGSLLQASADLGARPAQTFRTVMLPLALPGLAAGSVFTFSLTLGDYIIPSVVGAPGYFIGMMVYQQQGTAGNIPLAAAFSVVPIVLIMIYLAIAKRCGSVRCALAPALESGRRSAARLAAYAGLAFMHIPVLVIMLYAFTTEDRTYEFPPPGLTLHWFEARVRARRHLGSDAPVAWRLPPCATLLAIDPRHARGVRAGARQLPRQGDASRCCSCCRSRCPASSPASRCSRPSRCARPRSRLLDHRRRPRDVLHRHRLQQRRRAPAPPAARAGSRRRWISAPTAGRRSATSLLPQVATALLAGGMLAFALSFDEIIVTLFTAGHERTLPIWFFNELFRPRERPITNVVAVIVMS